MEIFKDTPYIRTGGSRRSALRPNISSPACAPLARRSSSPSPLQMADLEEATLTLDGKEYPCKGYKTAGSSTVEAPFYYLRDTKDACPWAAARARSSSSTATWVTGSIRTCSPTEPWASSPTTATPTMQTTT